MILATLKRSLLPLMYLAILGAATTANAYYDPGVQRWINRDPNGERGFMSRARRSTEANGNEFNRHVFVGNSSVDHFDGFGLKIYKCIRQAKSMPGKYHAYLWDDTQNRSCGRTGGVIAEGEDAEGDKGPDTPGHSCIEIPNSEGKETTVMDCCRSRKFSPFFPLINDCHNWADRCLNKAGLPDPRLDRTYDQEEDLPPADRSRGRPGRRY